LKSWLVSLIIENLWLSKIFDIDNQRFSNRIESKIQVGCNLWLQLFSYFMILSIVDTNHFMNRWYQPTSPLLAERRENQRFSITIINGWYRWYGLRIEDSSWLES
jgi:hypothetical protein